VQVAVVENCARHRCNIRLPALNSFGKNTLLAHKRHAFLLINVNPFLYIYSSNLINQYIIRSTIDLHLFGAISDKVITWCDKNPFTTKERNHSDSHTAAWHM
jgi:hypothetical protein